MKNNKFFVIILIFTIGGLDVKSQDTINLVDLFFLGQQKCDSCIDYFNEDRSSAKELLFVPCNNMADTIYALETQREAGQPVILMYWSKKFLITARNTSWGKPLQIYHKRVFHQKLMSLIEEWNLDSLVWNADKYCINPLHKVYATRIICMEGDVRINQFDFWDFYCEDFEDYYRLRELWGY